MRGHGLTWTKSYLPPHPWTNLSCVDSGHQKMYHRTKLPSFMWTPSCMTSFTGFIRDLKFCIGLSFVPNSMLYSSSSISCAGIMPICWALGDMLDWAEGTFWFLASALLLLPFFFLLLSPFLLLFFPLLFFLLFLFFFLSHLFHLLYPLPSLHLLLIFFSSSSFSFHFFLSFSFISFLCLFLF